MQATRRAGMTLLARAAAGLLLSRRVGRRRRSPDGGTAAGPAGLPGRPVDPHGRQPRCRRDRGRQDIPLLARNQETATHYRIEVEGRFPGSAGWPSTAARRPDLSVERRVATGHPMSWRSAGSRPSARASRRNPNAGPRRPAASMRTTSPCTACGRSRAAAPTAGFRRTGGGRRARRLGPAAGDDARRRNAPAARARHAGCHVASRPSRVDQARDLLRGPLGRGVFPPLPGAARPAECGRPAPAVPQPDRCRGHGAEVRAAFDAAFGPGAGDRVRIACRRDGQRNLVVELTLGLAGRIADDSSLAGLMAAAAPTAPGCPGGVVDPVGLQ